MKFVIEDRLKHRVTGVIVIVALLAIFLPDMMKKSNRRFEENLNISMRLPEKPVLPSVDIPKSKEMFKTVKVAHVDISPPTQKAVSQIAKAMPLVNEPQVSTSEPAKSSVIATIDLPRNVPEIVDPIKERSKIAQVKSGQYVVQLASFSQQRNAEMLVKKLRNQGYKASYNKLNNKNGVFYQVIVGQGHEKDEAINLQKKLASAMQLTGFVVKSGVS